MTSELARKAEQDTSKSPSDETEKSTSKLAHEAANAELDCRMFLAAFFVLPSNALSSMVLCLPAYLLMLQAVVVTLGSRRGMRHVLLVACCVAVELLFKVSDQRHDVCSIFLADIITLTSAVGTNLTIRRDT